MTDYTKLTPAEINAAIAEKVMGCREIANANRSLMWVWRDGTPMSRALRPHGDHNDMAMVRAEIRRRRLEFKFIDELDKIDGGVSNFFEIIDTPLHLQCIAALKAVEGAK